LKENVEHHAEEEEEGKLFPQVQQIIVDTAFLEDLGKRMEAEKSRRDAA